MMSCQTDVVVEAQLEQRWTSGLAILGDVSERSISHLEWAQGHFFLRQSGRRGGLRTKNQHNLPTSFRRASASTGFGRNRLPRATLPIPCSFDASQRGSELSPPWLEALPCWN